MSKTADDVEREAGALVARLLEALEMPRGYGWREDLARAIERVGQAQRHAPPEKTRRLQEIETLQRAVRQLQLQQGDVGDAEPVDQLLERVLEELEIKKGPTFLDDLARAIERRRK